MPPYWYADLTITLDPCPFTLELIVLINKGFTLTYSAIDANENEQLITNKIKQQHFNYLKQGSRFIKRHMSKSND